MIRPMPLRYEFLGTSLALNRFSEKELLALLGPAHDADFQPVEKPATFGIHHALTTPEGSAEFLLRKSEDGKQISLVFCLVRAGKPYLTTMHADAVSPGVYDINELTFDNLPEKLVGRFEITSVLGYIGQHLIHPLMQGYLPHPHEEKGTFSKANRLVNRHLPSNWEHPGY